ncbi:GspH/FimT family pseudopilin [Methylomicrobium lacus]|uniref:GspH/FimT family pseudopilin n=1 Tax=Methylomicrobium lacus TaxID=136992 RepID=UPI0035A97733
MEMRPFTSPCPTLRQTSTSTPRKQSGFTFIEALVVIAIIAILAALAAPSFKASIDKQRIMGATEAVLADLRWARSEAIARNKPVRVTFTTGSAWAYTITLGDGTVLKTVNGNGFPSIILSSATFSDGADGSVAYTTFSPARVKNANDGEVTLTSTLNTAQISVSKLGRTKICGSMLVGHPCS